MQTIKTLSCIYKKFMRVLKKVESTTVYATDVKVMSEHYVDVAIDFDGNPEEKVHVLYKGVYVNPLNWKEWLKAATSFMICEPDNSPEINLLTVSKPPLLRLKQPPKLIKLESENQCSSISIVTSQT